MITRIFGIAALIALPGWAMATDATLPETLSAQSDEVTLEQFLWLKRPVVVFSDSPADPRFVEQMRYLAADVDGLTIRDVVVLTDTDPTGKSALREKLRPRGFMLALVDKDGQVKLRKPAPWTVREITRSIDKWPTRQQEIREELGKE
ncbi:hypothetical protein TG4357_01055 [Thalassovita gelatinovora]|uniref:DUF4174 domain-containing protein n=1 Tax=Thalassovita gelatinovora TaxID=53501 RepID=A0A0P1F7Z6_THAGE|nr:DUF4174 domain-containing protein [Thalassovita gelatinovora]QIZ80221.1 DUF4174 domain-containing protein [Thalassovita gelatinovora]CUH64078.1 hypothetical protein TG4357_01055 [Thalassovita gelatinovora]SEQ82870.1 protein of unknown function [Thalassovita gelatinovora]